MYTFAMRARLTKWGNSIGIRLPKVFMMQMGIIPGKEVEIELHENNITISKPVESLGSLLKKVTSKSLHHETETGPAVGREVW